MVEKLFFLYFDVFYRDLKSLFFVYLVVVKDGEVIEVLKLIVW